MVKRIIAILGMAGCLLCANATKNYMTIEQLNGSKYSFLLDENPVITYENGILVVNGNATTQYSIESIKNYHFTENDETAVKNQKSETLRITTLNESSLQVQNAKASEKVTLVNVNGQAVFSASTDNEGSAIVTLPAQKGVYVLSVGTQSIKVIRK